MKISAQDIDFSTSAEETIVCQYDGNPMSIGFKSSFLIDILNNISAQNIIIELATRHVQESSCRKNRKKTKTC